MNYKRLGNYIREADVRNENDNITNLLGINIDKYYMPSVANVVGTDLSRYKVVEKNQFVCNRMHVGRDKRLPIALSTREEKFIVSPAYDVFEIIDRNELLPEYLMMWFSRKEFDRNTWFYTDADVRGGLNWNSFLNMQLPIPSPEKQCEIVAEYNAVQNRINLNNQLIQKLEETAQAIYKRWFVDFEFPNEDGKPYKSSGGEMVESELGEIPKGWRVRRLSDYIESASKQHQFDVDSLIFFNTSDILNGEFLHETYSPVEEMPGQAKKEIKKYDILYSEIRPANKRFALVRVDNTEDYVVSTKLMVLRCLNNELSVLRLYHYLTADSFIEILQQSAEGRSGTFPQITFEEDIYNKKFIVGSKDVEYIWNEFLNNYYKQVFSRKDENKYLSKLQSLLLSRMTII